MNHAITPMGKLPASSRKNTNFPSSFNLRSPKAGGLREGKCKLSLFRKKEPDEAQIAALEQVFPNFFVGKIMKQGESFGEIALQHRTRR